MLTAIVGLVSATAALGAAGVGLVTGVVSLVTTIINARAQGIERGDRRHEPLKLVVRRLDRSGKVREEIVLNVPHRELVTEEVVTRALSAGLERLTKEDHEDD